MESESDLAERVRRHQEFLENEWVPALDRFQARYAPNGRFEKVGETEDCLEFPEFDDYADSRICEIRKERYRSHMQTCSDCASLFERLQNYLDQTRSSNILAVLFRKAIALPYRAKDYISERFPEIKQRAENLLMGYR